MVGVASLGWLLLLVSLFCYVLGPVCLVGAVLVVTCTCVGMGLVFGWMMRYFVLWALFMWIFVTVFLVWFFRWFGLWKRCGFRVVVFGGIGILGL